MAKKPEDVAAWARECRACIGVGPSVAAVSGVIDLIGPVWGGRHPFVHAGDVHAPPLTLSPVIWTLRMKAGVHHTGDAM